MSMESAYFGELKLQREHRFLSCNTLCELFRHIWCCWFWCCCIDSELPKRSVPAFFGRLGHEMHAECKIWRIHSLGINWLKSARNNYIIARKPQLATTEHRPCVRLLESAVMVCVVCS
jgi:hypothetical protein